MQLIDCADTCAGNPVGPCELFVNVTYRHWLAQLATLNEKSLPQGRLFTFCFYSLVFVDQSPPEKMTAGSAETGGT